MADIMRAAPASPVSTPTWRSPAAPRPGSSFMVVASTGQRSRSPTFAAPRGSRPRRRLHALWRSPSQLLVLALVGVTFTSPPWASSGTAFPALHATGAPLAATPESPGSLTAVAVRRGPFHLPWRPRMATRRPQRPPTSVPSGGGAVGDHAH